MIDFSKIVFFDFECFSEVDVTKVGSYNYSHHKSTEINSLAYKFAGQDKEYVWSPEIPTFYASCPKNLKWAIDNGYTFVGHNVFFDLCIWNEIGHRLLDFPYLPFNQTADTMALCGAHALPLSLEGAAIALEFAEGKDKEGHDLMLLMCKPKKPTKKDPRTRVWDSESRDRLIQYNIVDVRVTEHIWNTLEYLTDQEHEIWRFTMDTNYFGIPADLRTARSAINLFRKLKEKYTAELQDLTFGVVKTGGQTKVIKQYFDDTYGIKLATLDKYVVEKLIKNKKIPESARRLAELRQILNRSSIAKFQKIIDTSDHDNVYENPDIGTVRETLVYHLASTGRWGAKRLQVQNQIKAFYVLKDENPEERLELMAELIRSENLDVWELFYGNKSKPLAGYIRSCLFDPHGSDIFCGDYSGVEARCAFWLAGDLEALEDDKNGVDKYIKLASKIFRKSENDVTRWERNQIGKPGVLSTIYQAGGPKVAENLVEKTDLDIEQLGKDVIIDKIQKHDFSLFDFCNLIKYKAYADKKLEPEYSRFISKVLNGGEDKYIIQNPFKYDYTRAFGITIVTTFRTTYPKIPAYWKAIDKAIKRALLYNEIVKFGVVTIIPTERFLFILLPSGRKLAYYKARVENTINKFGKEAQEIIYFGVDEETKQFKKHHTFGGMFTEHIDSGICRDLLALAMLRHQKAGYRCLFSAHDENVAFKRGGNLEEFLDIMRMKPAWAKGFPIEVEGWKGKRYRK